MEALRKIGLSDYESKIYVALLNLGASNAKEISKESTVPQTATYPNLKSLGKKKLIHVISGEVALYDALDPKIAINAYAEKIKNQTEKTFQEAINKISEIKQKPNSQITNEPIKVSSGLEISSNWFAHTAAEAKKEIFIMGWKFDSAKNKIKLKKIFMDLKNKKIDLRLITNDKNYTKNIHLQEIKKMKVPIRFNSFDNFSIIIVDGVETKITLKNPLLEERLNLQIGDKDLSNALREYFLINWKKSKEI